MEEESESEYSEDENNSPFSSTPPGPRSPQQKEPAWTAPELSWNAEHDFDLSPKTKEIEPSIPLPKPHIEAQDMECQWVKPLSRSLGMRTCR